MLHVYCLCQSKNIRFLFIKIAPNTLFQLYNCKISFWSYVNNRRQKKKEKMFRSLAFPIHRTMNDCNC